MRSSRPDRQGLRLLSGNLHKRSASKQRIWAAVIFSVGVLVGMLMMGASVYADFEAYLFDLYLDAASTPRLIDCPILLSSNESGVVSASIKNRSDEITKRLVRTVISRGHLTLMREFEQWLVLDPGEIVKLEWEVTEKDAAYGHLIFTRLLLFEDSRNPINRGSCGILILDLPWGLNGRSAVTLMYAISITCIFISTIMWWRHGRSYTGLRLEATRAIYILGVVVILGLVFILLGLWELAATTFYLSVLSIGVVLPHFVINFFTSNR